MAKKRITRKQLLKEPDEFITLWTKIIQWCRKNPKRLIYSAGALIVIIALVVGIRTYNDRRSRAGFELLGLGQHDIQALDDKTDADLSTADKDFQELIDNFGGRTAGRIGRIIFANLQLTKGSPEKAIELYKAALADYEKDPSLGNFVLNGLASAYELKAMTPESIENYEKIVQSENKVLKDRALFHLGRLYRQAGEGEKSDRAYTQLISDFPESLFTPIAKEITAG